MAVESARHYSLSEYIRGTPISYRDNFRHHGEGDYFDSGDLGLLLRARKLIDDDINHPELIARHTRYATAADEVEPPAEDQLVGRLS